MPFLAPEEMAALHVEDLIFHVVGKTQADLILMDEIMAADATVGLQKWFLDRLRTANGGNVFDFTKPSLVRDSLAAIQANPSCFVAESRSLAQGFQNQHTGATAKGVFLVMRLSCQGNMLHALMKYDHEETLSYLTDLEGGKRRAEVKRILNTFTEKTESVQKCCIVRLTPDGGEICVRDRSNKKNISDYFRAFLGVKRRHDARSLTTKLTEVTKAAVRRVMDDLSPEVARNLNQRIFDAIQTTAGFDPEDPLPFLIAVVGPLPDNSKLQKVFLRELEKENVDQEAFEFDKAAVRRPRRRRITTQEGISVVYDSADASLISTERRGDRDVITINSAKITEHDDEPDPAKRLRVRASSANSDSAQRDAPSV